MKKRCSGCRNWVKWKHDQFGGGLCDLHDQRASSDYKCKDWEPIPYKRVKFKVDEEYFQR